MGGNISLKITIIFSVVVLCIGIFIVPISGLNSVKPAIITKTYSNTFYVGGSGQDNYTTIQDAIDNASDGDTVFVFDDLSPYIENILIDVSLQIIGENKETTIIDGNENKCVVKLLADKIKISKFTIQNAGFDVDLAGILVNSSSNTISEIKITSNTCYGNAYGILILDNATNNLIINNTIQNNYYAGIEIRHSKNNIILHNNLSNNAHGSICVGWSENNSIKKNIIKDNICISLLKSKNNTIDRNHIINNGIAIILTNSGNNAIVKNNLIKTRHNILLNINVLLGSDENIKNKWDHNYWNRPRLLPKLILGFGKIDDKKIKFVEIDWHPAQEPYVIP
jgi:parallel beta-helix repeat protein